MNVDFCFQDPTCRETLYLFEAIIAALQDAREWLGVFAFASESGARTLLEDPAVEHFLEAGGTLRLIVGIDAVTNRATLEYLAAAERERRNITVRVFWNNTPALFHPKLSHFRGLAGRETLILGSGNLTPGGLRQNFEAYIIIRSSRDREPIHVTSLDRFFQDQADLLRPIDEEILERAARNIVVGRRGRRRRVEVEPEVEEAIAEEIVERREQAAAVARDRVLVARVPRAGVRWHQVHFNRDVVRDFFQVEPGTAQRVYLVQRRPDGSLSEQEVHPCILSQRNLNYKIELGARRDADYPNGVPIAVFRELQTRSFEYMLIFPHEPGYDEMFRLTEELPTVGRGFARVITDTETLRQYWADSPLLTG